MAMAKGLNKIQIIGHLGSSPDMKISPSGSPLTNFSVAVNRGRRNQDGQTTEETDWFRVVCWNKLAETADQYLKKGSRVYVEGRLQIRKYIANGGEQRTSVEIVASDLLMLSAREEKAEHATASTKSDKSRPAPAKPAWSAEEEFFGELDDLPF
jgi:single-strand DNA-binding protein